MGRITKTYDERHNEFLDVAQGLFFSKGYERTSVSEIIKAVGVAKGTFYHYFDTKADILDAIAKRQYAQVVAVLQPMLADPTLNAKERFEQVFSQIGNWKIARKQLMLDMVRVLYADENLRLRTRMRHEAVLNLTPILEAIIQQGCDEGLFDVQYPFETAELILKMAETREEAVIAIILADDYEATAIDHVKRQISAYNQGVERILGAAEGTLTLLDDRAIDTWITELDIQTTDKQSR